MHACMWRGREDNDRGGGRRTRRRREGRRSKKSITRQKGQGRKGERKRERHLGLKGGQFGFSLAEEAGEQLVRGPNVQAGKAVEEIGELLRWRKGREGGRVQKEGRGKRGEGAGAERNAVSPGNGTSRGSPRPFPKMPVYGIAPVSNTLFCSCTPTMASVDPSLPPSLPTSTKASPGWTPSLLKPLMVLASSTALNVWRTVAVRSTSRRVAGCRLVGLWRRLANAAFPRLGRRGEGGVGEGPVRRVGGEDGKIKT